MPCHISPAAGHVGGVDDEARFEELYRAHADEVHAYARRRSNALTADEVVADVFLVVWRRLDRVPAHALPWLLAVARRILANHRRSSRRVAALHDRLGASITPPEEATVAHDVLGALAGLSERDREVLLLAAWEGLSQEEIAEVLVITRSAVAARLRRARRRLAEMLAAEATDVDQLEARG